MLTLLLKKSTYITDKDVIERCFTNAIELVGKEMSVDEVMSEILKDKPFYDSSGGGITLSGGEPMLQFEFTYELFKKSKMYGLHTCMETCGFAASEQYKYIAEYVDIFLFDYKESDIKKHKVYTGVSNELILNNLKLIDTLGAKIILRCPIIPTLNDRQNHFNNIAKMANSLKNILEVNVEPYHMLGVCKTDKLDKRNEFKGMRLPEESEIDYWIKTIQSKTNISVRKA